MHYPEGYVMRDPTAETTAPRRARCRPPESLDGRSIALLDIGKLRGDEFLDALVLRSVNTLTY